MRHLHEMFKVGDIPLFKDLPPSQPEWRVNAWVYVVMVIPLIVYFLLKL